MKKTEQLTAIEIKLGAAAYEAKHSKIREAMKPDSTFMETRRASKIASVTGGFDVDKAPNATE
jgi:hypothetical protein